MGCSFKRQKGVTIVNAFQSILNNSKRKPNKIWVDQGSELYNSSFKKTVKRESHRDVFNIQRRKICCC